MNDRNLEKMDRLFRQEALRELAEYPPPSVDVEARVLETIRRSQEKKAMALLFLPFRWVMAAAAAAAMVMVSFASWQEMGNGETPTVTEIENAMDELADPLIAWLEV